MTPSKDSLPAQAQAEADYEHHLVTDTSRIRAELGYQERVSREEALRETINWERANPPADVNSSQFDYAAEDAALAKLKRRGHAGTD